jgi:dipeptidase D
MEISIRGLLGGHSGMDIDKGRANANKLMNRVLYQTKSLFPVQLTAFDGGSLRNAIPREASAVISIVKENKAALELTLNKLFEELKTEFSTLEKELKFSVKTIETETEAISDEDTIKILNTIYGVPNGVFRMSPDIESLVETSSSLARIIIKDGKFISQSLQRSSVESTKDDVANSVRASFENMGCAVVQNGDYPGWKPNPSSSILQVMADLYRKLYKEEPQIKACHAGLECGILGSHFPNMDMISFGPNIRAAHSPDEKVQISSVQKFWSFLLEVLKETPTK